MSAFVPHRFSRAIFFSLTVFAVSALISFIYFSRPAKSAPSFLPHRMVIPTPTPTPDPLRPLNLLLLGYAGPHHDGGNLSDTLILAHIDARAKQVTLISLPRDLWVSLPLTDQASLGAKLNAAWAIGNDDARYPHKPAAYRGQNGGYNLVGYSVKAVTGLNLDYVIAVNFGGFEAIISLLGGVTVNVPYTFDDSYYPLEGKEIDTCNRSPADVQTVTATLSGELLEHQFPCRYETLHFDQGPQTMDAETALKFVRSRHSEIGGGDFGRAARQQALLVGLKTKILSVSSLPKLLPLISTILKNVRSNLNLKLIEPLLTIYPDLNTFTIKNITLNQKDLLTFSVSADGQSILIPVLGESNFTALHQFISQSFLPDLSPTP